MIQRIQTLYLLVCAMVCACAAWLPLGSFIQADGSIDTLKSLMLVVADGTRSYSPWALFVIMAFVVSLDVVCICIYKNRMMQIRICILNILLTVGFYIVLAIFIWILRADSSFVPSWIVVLPLLAIVLHWLALRAIGKDEALVRAYEHLR
ncbi:MAG: DUF4293 domain-containing protein [Bacteroidales bacterium]|nr:DUF4293 domain-containing protein [Bacteroidales bacterium]